MELPFPFRFSQWAKYSNCIIVPEAMYELVNWEQIQDLDRYIGDRTDLRIRRENLKIIARGVGIKPAKFRDELKRRGLMNFYRIIDEKYSDKTDSSDENRKRSYDGGESRIFADASPPLVGSGYPVASLTPPRHKRPAFCPYSPPPLPPVQETPVAMDSSNDPVSFFQFSSPFLFPTGTDLSPALQPGSLECSPSILERSPPPQIPSPLRIPRSSQTPQTEESSDQILRGLDEMIFGKNGQK